MTNVQTTTHHDEDSSHIEVRDMYRRLVTVAELLKKSTHEHTHAIEIVQPEEYKKHRNPKLLYRDV